MFIFSTRLLYSLLLLNVSTVIGIERQGICEGKGCFVIFSADIQPLHTSLLI